MTVARRFARNLAVNLLTVLVVTTVVAIWHFHAASNWTVDPTAHNHVHQTHWTNHWPSPHSETGD